MTTVMRVKRVSCRSESGSHAAFTGAVLNKYSTVTADLVVEDYCDGADTRISRAVVGQPIIVLFDAGDESPLHNGVTLFYRRY